MRFSRPFVDISSELDCLECPAMFINILRKEPQPVKNFLTLMLYKLFISILLFFLTLMLYKLFIIIILCQCNILEEIFSIVVNNNSYIANAWLKITNKFTMTLLHHKKRNCIYWWILSSIRPLKTTCTNFGGFYYTLY